MAKFWEQDDVLIENDDGDLVECDDCPCVEEEPDCPCPVTTSQGAAVISGSGGFDGTYTYDVYCWHHMSDPWTRWNFTKGFTTFSVQQCDDNTWCLPSFLGSTSACSCGGSMQTASGTLNCASGHLVGTLTLGGVTVTFS